MQVRSPQGTVAGLPDVLMDGDRCRLDRAGREYAEKVGDDYYLKAPIGAGPWLPVSFGRVELVLEAFDGYWRKTPLKRPVPRHPRRGGRVWRR
jgi:ABC-type transport system substrate-binding protein